MDDLRNNWPEAGPIARPEAMRRHGLDRNVVQNAGGNHRNPPRKQGMALILGKFHCSRGGLI
jgi:hypothetical protein